MNCIKIKANLDPEHDVDVYGLYLVIHEFTVANYPDCFAKFVFKFVWITLPN